jgi:16S rRNA (uracil1498-N3)-methyltransferase
LGQQIGSLARVHRFLIPPAAARLEMVTLVGDEAHHASRVVRVEPGETVALLDGAGTELLGEVRSVDRRAVTIGVTGRREHPRPTAQVTLIQALAKSAAMEGLVHRAVELGCARLVPLVGERSVSRPEDGETKRAKWQAIADEACKQSGNPWRLTVEPPLTPFVWLNRHDLPELLLIASLADAPTSVRRRFEEYRETRRRNPRSVGVLVGPEGDFTTPEHALFREAGARSVSLGPLVLRVETAATVLLGLAGQELAAASAAA